MGLPDIARAARDLTRERPPEKNASENYLTLPDLTRRWRYTRQGVHKLVGREDFPKPRITGNGGKTRLWAAADIEDYERDRPELHSEAAKFLKVRGFARALRKGAQQPTG